MSETREIGNSWDNRGETTEQDTFVLPFSPLLESGDTGGDDDAWWDDDEWFMPLAEPRRPGPSHVACDKCGGAMAASPSIPGVFAVVCVACGKTYEALESDFRDEAGSTGVAYVLQHTDSLLWERDEALAS